MSSSTTVPFSTLVPGFEFMKELLGATQATQAGMPSMGAWIAPTLDPKELDKRIDQLKTVQFWLEQNTRMVQTTIQALEVQRMTLSTLESMNVPVADMAQAFTAHVPEPAHPPGPAQTAQTTQTKQKRTAKPSTKSSTKTRDKVANEALVDPMKWWGALTQQFADLASKALSEAPATSATSTAQHPSKSSAKSSAHSSAKPSAKKASAANRAKSPRQRV